MARYKVTLVRTDRVTSVVEVRARSKDEAEDKALRMKDEAKFDAVEESSVDVDYIEELP